MRRRAIPLAAIALACAPPAPDEAAERVELTIPRGASLAQAARLLETEGVITSPELFRFYATLSGRSRAVQAGTYALPRGASVRTVLGLLVAGRPAERRLVVPEGLMLDEVARAVQDQLGIPAAQFLVVASDSALRARLGVPGASLEGYLYPSTYLVRVDATAHDVVRQMVREFEQRWRPTWDDRLDTLRLTRHEAVTLASIVEGEVRHDPDRRYVASVYHNRLRQGMRLQADPTVIYALGTRRLLFERDYETRSPYNTYLVDGLPPGPIGAPSDASLSAALYPAHTDLLYFVARPDGQHVFSRTYAEHQRAIAAVRELERELGLR